MLEYIWIFDINRRRYRRNADGREYGSPIWREHWVKRRVVAETSRSWVLEGGKKVAKGLKAVPGSGVAFSEFEIDKLAYIHDNAYAISKAVADIKDYHLLCKIAALVGYEAPEQPD